MVTELLKHVPKKTYCYSNGCHEHEIPIGATVVYSSTG